MDTNGFIFYEPARAKPKARVSMTISPNKGVSLTGAVYQALNEPKYVNLLYHRAKKLVILRSCDPGTTGAYAVKADKYGCFNISQRSLSDVIFEITNWAKDFSYKCAGRYDTEAAGVVFNLNIAEMTEKRKYTRNKAATA